MAAENYIAVLAQYGGKQSDYIFAKSHALWQAKLIQEAGNWPTAQKEGLEITQLFLKERKNPDNPVFKLAEECMNKAGNNPIFQKEWPELRARAAGE